MEAGGLGVSWLVFNYDHSFIALATVFFIVNYNRKTFIVQATEHSSNVAPNHSMNSKILPTRVLPRKFTRKKF